MMDMGYLLLVAVPAMILSGGASLLVQGTFARYSRVPAASGMTGAEAAQRLLDYANIHDVQIVPVPGQLTDHYDPVNKRLALSEPVYHSHSVAAIGVATHEAGHAIQHATGYFPLWIRSGLVPFAGFAQIGIYLAAFGVMVNAAGMVLVGVLIFSGLLLFQLVTLPVEFDASARAKRLMVDAGIVDRREGAGASAVLNAAALTYVAAAIGSLLTVLYYLWRSGILGGRSRDE